MAAWQGVGRQRSINGLLYVPGQRRDFDHWRQLGNEGWGWDDVLPLFRRAENWEGGADEVRGGEGPLSVSRNRVSRDIIDAWIDAAIHAGYPRVDDYMAIIRKGLAISR